MAVEQTIAELLIEIGVDVEGANKAAKEIKGVTDSAEKTRKKGGASLKKFAKGAGLAFAAVGAAAIAAGVAIFKLVDNVTAAGDEVAKAARAAGLASDEYQRLAFAADRSGASTQVLSKAAKNIGKFFADSQTKTTPFTEALDKVGLSMAAIEKLSFEERLGAIGDALNFVSDESERLALSQKLVGEEAGPQLASLLAEGTAGIRKLGDEAERLGAVLGKDALAASEDFQDQMTNLKTTISAVVNEVGIALIPVVRDLVVSTQKWVIENKTLVSIKVKDFIEKTIPVLKDLLALLLKVIDGLGSFINAAGGVEGAAVAATAAFIGMKIAAAGALGPIGLIITAFVTLLPLALKLGDRLGDVAFQMSKVGRESRALDALAGGRTGKRGAPGVLTIDPKDRREFDRISKIRQGASDRINKALARGDDASPDDLKKLATTQKSLARINAQGAAAGQARAQQAGIEGEAAQESAQFQQSFQARQAAGARVREAIGSRRGADALVSQVIQGKLTEAQAIAQGKRKKGGGRAKKPKEEEATVRALTPLEEFAKSRGFDVLPTRQVKLKDEDIRPEAVINITNNNFDIEQNISGVTDALKAAQESVRLIKEEFDRRLSQAGQSAQTNLVR